jgi:hypothetical protein
LRDDIALVPRGASVDGAAAGAQPVSQPPTPGSVRGR